MAARGSGGQHRLAGCLPRALRGIDDLQRPDRRVRVREGQCLGGGLPEHLLHFNGKAGTSQPAPSGVQLRSIAPDGHGGLWFSAARPKASQPPLAEHRSATGTWSGHTLPTGTGQAFGMTLIPGTSSLWASGYLETNGSTGSDAVIWGDGPAA